MVETDARQQRGMEIATRGGVVRAGDDWVVPSQSFNGRYRVSGERGTYRCNCPDHELRGSPCKHIFAVEYVLRRETAPDGTVTETRAMRVTYAQNWAAYNAAQTTEKEHFLRLLHDLTSKVPTPEQKGAGRRRLPLSDMLFAAAFKVYSGFSGRRFDTDLRVARDNGLIDRAPAFNTIFDVLRLEEVTPILHDLITASAKPLAAVESQFAVDSTGIGTQCFYRHYSAKYGHDREKREFVKLHALVGTKTNIIAACKITDRENDHGDVSEFKPLVEDAAQHFQMKEISADLAYSSLANLEVTESIGAVPYIPFKSNAVAVSKSHKGSSRTWARLFHYFQMNRDEFLGHYHQRSNVESVFSMMKRCIGDTLRTRGRVSQTNEALLMVLCHNIRVLIHEAHELGITPMLDQCARAAMPQAVRRLVAQ